MRRHLKPWHWRVGLIGLASFFVSLGGGYWVVRVVQHLIEQSANLEKMKLISTQDHQAAQSQKTWVQRLAEEPSLVARMSQHPYMNPPDRQTLHQHLKGLSQGVELERVTFSPDERFFQEGEHALCRQQITVTFTAHHDVAVVEWINRVVDQFPGVIVVKKISLSFQDHQKMRLKGEIVWDWGFVRLSLRP